MRVTPDRLGAHLQERLLPVYVVSGAELPDEGDLSLSDSFAQVWGESPWDWLGVGDAARESA